MKLIDNVKTWFAKLVDKHGPTIVRDAAIVKLELLERDLEEAIEKVSKVKNNIEELKNIVKSRTEQLEQSKNA